MVYLGLALLAIGALAFGFALSRSGEPEELPGPLESVHPQPGDLVLPQTTIEIDLEVGYRAEIFVDGWQVSDANFVEGTGVYRWAPSPSNPTINEWTTGSHTIRVTWDTIDGLADPGAYEWSFRVG